MKRIYLVLVATIITINIACAQSGWIDYRIDNKLSVKLPAKPQSINKSSIKAVTKDSLICIVTKVDFFTTVQMDSTILAPLLPTQEFADELRTGMRGQMAGFTLGDIKIGKWKGYYCYTIEGGNASKKSKLYTFMVIIGSNMYGLSAMMPDKKSTKDKDDFFSSLVIN
jgi:hypothetical protein